MRKNNSRPNYRKFRISEVSVYMYATMTVLCVCVCDSYFTTLSVARLYAVKW
jgi:hypothetical protein